MKPLGLLEGVGLELELVIVDRETLDVRPLADRLLFEVSGNQSGDHDAGRIGWSNELVLHLVELKMTAPEPDLSTVAPAFQENVGSIERALAAHGARVMPSGMHPWMDPARETVLWPHEYGEVYRAYDALFDCRRHGWANLQATHLNLSFATEEEFARLHAAVRLVLPLVPALAASSPLVEGRATGILDNRLAAYRTNSARVPAMAGALIPEPVFDIAGYHERILEPIEAEISRLEPEGILRGEWLNARGAIARFERSAFEIRLLDTQECPAADVAVAWALTCVVRALCEERWCSSAEQRAFATEPLAACLSGTTARGPTAPVADRSYARALGWSGERAPTAGELWRALVEEVVASDPRTSAELVSPLQTILREGTLSQRILRALGQRPSKPRLVSLYRDLCDCLSEGRAFHAG